jgi:hypothetical protein
VSVQPDGTPPPGRVPVAPVVVNLPTTTGLVQGWIQAVGMLLISLALLLLSVAVLRNPAPSIAAPDGAGKGPVRPGPTPPPVAPVLPPVERPPSPQQSDVARSVVAYRDGLDERFDEWADRVDDEKLNNVDEIGTAFRENGLTIANPLHAEILKHCDSAGNVTDRKGLSGALRSVARALRGK